MLLQLTNKGLYCPPGNFYIDPSGGVEHAVITHAHSDHARRGSHIYYSTRSGAGLLRTRLSQKINVITREYGEIFYFGDVQVSFHPAGHILGSAQVRIEYQNDVWVASGDYKREADPTCEPFEIVPCKTYVTEATFGTPTYRWDKSADMGREIFDWWQENASENYNSVVFGYSLGKTQRVLGLLKPFAQDPIYCASAATELIDCYRRERMPLAPSICLSQVKSPLSRALVIAPQSFLKTEQASLLGSRFRTAFASGWMARSDTRSSSYNSESAYDKGFTLSDHADWDDLVRTICETGAQRVYVQHRGQGALVRHLNTLGIKAFPVEKLESNDHPFQMTFGLT